jgi:hypothetical protein
VDPLRFGDVTARLRAHGLRCEVLELAGGGTLLATERGGRLMPFDEHGESVLWLSPALRAREAFEALLREDHWNLGGERIWIAPEIQFTIRDRRDFWGSYALPPAMDPGRWTVEALGDAGLVLRQELALEAFNLAKGSKRLAVERRVTPALDPLRLVPDRSEVWADVTYFGYRHEVTLRDVEPNAIRAQAWNLIQLVPGGRVLLPTIGRAQQRDYMEPVGPHQRVGDDCVELSLSGRHRYKVGYGALQHYGRAGYARMLGGQRAQLLVRAFFTDPSTHYLEEPPDRPGEHGDSLHVYNDDGNAGGFGEIECYGRAIGGPVGGPDAATASTDATLLWSYSGTVAALAGVARLLLGTAAAGSIAALGEEAGAV